MILFSTLFCASVVLTQAKTRTVGGQDATYGDFPYICSLQRSFVNKWAHRCGSVIWNNNHLITAAHCLGSLTTNHRVVCGVQHLHGHDQYRVHRSLSSYVKHPHWNPPASFSSDIAVIKLSSPLTFNSHVNKITFARNGSFAGQSCVLSGWGFRPGIGDSEAISGEPISETLQEVNMTATVNSYCKQFFPNRISDGQICYFRGEGYDACFMDSGGPAVCGDYMTGINSFGDPDCAGTSPTVYTRVSHVYDWLVSQAGSN